MSQTVVIIGGGAAGFFAAVTCAKKSPTTQVILLEKTRSLLSKVRISGGGRCNVTHSCFEPKELVKNYPRGQKELLGPFHRFQPRDTVQWFESRGTLLKTEEDGRMFPITDDSQSIILCLQEEAKKTGVDIHLQQAVQKIEKTKNGFVIHLEKASLIPCDKIILATGSNKDGHALAESLGHTIVPPVPSLFTFNVPTSPLLDLSGISVADVLLRIEGTQLTQEGPLLLTHFGFSGPAALKLSAWGARILHAMDYKATLLINWLPGFTNEDFFKLKALHPSHTIGNLLPSSLAKQLTKTLLLKIGIDPQKKIGDLSHKILSQLADKLVADSYLIQGKTTYKQEFVTAGGVALDEVNFKTMESILCKGLYFAGEVLDIDAVTGGFNFQNAWTTGWIAGMSLSF